MAPAMQWYVGEFDCLQVAINAAGQITGAAHLRDDGLAARDLLRGHGQQLRHVRASVPRQLALPRDLCRPGTRY